MNIYRVGGCVRDELLGIIPKDIDYVVTGSSITEMENNGFKQVGKSFPVFIHPKTRHEYALARTEKKQGSGYTGFTTNTDGVTLEEDLSRRDVSINSIAIDDKGQIIDPCGGVQDIKNMVIRHNSHAFSDDPLRVLRVARFYAKFFNLGFTIHDSTLSAMRDVRDNELMDISQDRIWLETEKALSTDNPEVYFRTLRKVGALMCLYPEIHDMIGKTQNPVYHGEGDAFDHSMLVLKIAVGENNCTQTRFAALTHDIGKGQTDTALLPKHHGHEDIGAEIIKSMCKRMNIPGNYRDLAIVVAKYHMEHHKVFEMKPKKVLKLLEYTDAIRKPERFHKFLDVCKYDYRGRILEIKYMGYSKNRFLQEVHNAKLNAVKSIRSL